MHGADDAHMLPHAACSAMLVTALVAVPLIGPPLTGIRWSEAAPLLYGAPQYLLDPPPKSPLLA